MIYEEAAISEGGRMPTGVYVWRTTNGETLQQYVEDVTFYDAREHAAIVLNSPAQDLRFVRLG